MLDRLAGADSHGAARVAPGSANSPPRDSLWVFVSTIGELNAIGPFLRQLAARLSRLQLVLITDRSIYSESYLAQYPAAEVVEIDANNGNAQVLAAARPPRLFVIAEIPCLPSDAPCRLPFGYLYVARQQGARVALVNGWLYGYAPSCRMDSIERNWLGRDYLRMFDLLAVQCEKALHFLLSAGAEPGRVHVTGNIKFDALDSKPRPPEETPSPKLLESLSQSGRPVIVAGCVTDDDERDLVLDAFVLLRSTQPKAAMVLAPRHPENASVMESLAGALRERQLVGRLRSASADERFKMEETVLVLDTMGELRDFYAVATIAHVGCNHNVLEPLAYRKPVSVRPGWERTYPSYPVYLLVSQARLLIESDDSATLAKAWHELIEDPEVHDRMRGRIEQTIGAQGRASRRTMELVEAYCELPR